MKQAVPWLALGTVWASPFAFGAVERRFWFPMALAWIFLGALSAQGGPSAEPQPLARALGRALLPVHALFAIQLLPLPGSILALISPGSYAAYFLPDPGDGRLRCISVSPRATIEAWFYFAALQGLLIAISALPSRHRARAVGVFLLSGLALGAEGLWQSRSSHPYHLYGVIPVESPQGLQASTFGPFHNRNHFATITAMAAAIALAMAARIVKASGGWRRLLGAGSDMARLIVFVGVAGFLALATAASGSRSGTLSLLLALGLILLGAMSRRAAVVSLAIVIFGLLASGPFVLERFSSFDFRASRLDPWEDMTRVWHFFPVFGSGLGAFAASYWPYQQVVTYELWEHAHNEYLEWFLDGGILGVVLALVALGRLRRALGWRSDLAPIATAALSVVAVQALLEFPLRIPSGAGMLIAVLALALRTREA